MTYKFFKITLDVYALSLKIHTHTHTHVIVEYSDGFFFLRTIDFIHSFFILEYVFSAIAYLHQSHTIRITK